MATRYDLVPRPLWRYLGPAFRGLDTDLTAVETSGGGGGGPSDLAYDTAARKPNTTLEKGDRLDSGHTYTVRASHPNTRFKWANGRLVHDILGGVDSAAYAGVELPGPVGRVWVDFEFTGANPEEVVLIASGGNRPFTQPENNPDALVGNGFTSAATHLVLSPTRLNYSILTGTPFGLDTLADVYFNPPLPTGQRFTLIVDLHGDTVTITSPLGTQVVRTDPRIGTAAFRGPYAAVELFAGSTSTPTLIHGWGAAQESPDAARKFIPPAEPPVAMTFMPSTAVDVPAPGSSTVISPQFALPAVIPTSGKLLVTVQYFLDKTTGTYLIGLNSGAGSGDGIQRVRTSAHGGTIRAQWLWTHPVPGTRVTIRPEHFLVDGGTATARFHSAMGYYGVISASPMG